VVVRTPMRLLPLFFATTRGRLFKMKKPNIYGLQNYSVIPVEILTDANLSLAAIGLAAYITYEYQALKMHKDADLFFDRITLAKGYFQGATAYNELVTAGYIPDFLKEGIEL